MPWGPAYPLPSEPRAEKSGRAVHTWCCGALRGSAVPGSSSAPGPAAWALPCGAASGEAGKPLTPAGSPWAARGHGGTRALRRRLDSPLPGRDPGVSRAVLVPTWKRPRRRRNTRRNRAGVSGVRRSEPERTGPGLAPSPFVHRPGAGAGSAAGDKAVASSGAAPAAAKPGAGRSPPARCGRGSRHSAPVPPAGFMRRAAGGPAGVGGAGQVVPAGPSSLAPSPPGGEGSGEGAAWPVRPAPFPALICPGSAAPLLAGRRGPNGDRRQPARPRLPGLPARPLVPPQRPPPATPTAPPGPAAAAPSPGPGRPARAGAAAAEAAAAAVPLPTWPIRALPSPRGPAAAAATPAGCRGPPARPRSRLSPSSRSKMFIGGLSWQTTQGERRGAPHLPPGPGVAELGLSTGGVRRGQDGTGHPRWVLYLQRACGSTSASSAR